MGIRASAFVAIRHLGGSVSPGALSLGRLVIAAVVLGAMVLAVRRPRRWPTRRDLPLLVACGVLWFGFYNIALNAAEQLIDAGTAAMLVQIGPIIVALLAAVFLGEPLTRWLVAGALVGFAGVAVIGLAGSGHASGDVGGVLLAVLAAVLYGAGVVTQKPLLARIPTLEMTSLRASSASSSAFPGPATSCPRLPRHRAGPSRSSPTSASSRPPSRSPRGASRCRAAMPAGSPSRASSSR